MTEKWLAVAAADGGRIVAARNVPGKNASFSWFKAWEPDAPINLSGQEEPTLFGTRVVAHSGSVISVQDSPRWRPSSGRAAAGSRGPTANA